jgi:hypothetical protein
MIDREGMVVARAGWLDHSVALEDRIATLRWTPHAKRSPNRGATSTRSGHVHLHVALSAET